MAGRHDIADLARQALVGPVAVVIVGSVILLILPLRTPLNPYDEGLALVSGLRVLRGEVPFRDFAAVYPPAQSYALAALFGLAGVSIAVERAFDLAVRLLMVSAIYAVSAHLIRNRWYAASAALVAALLLSSAGVFGYTTFPALLGVFTAVLAWFQYERRGQRSWIVVSGAAVGATSGFSLDLCAVAAVALMTGLSVKHALESRATFRAPLVRDVVLFVSGLVAVALPFWSYVCAQAGWGEVWGQLWSHIVIFRETRALPFPDVLPPLFTWHRCGLSLACFEATWGGWARFLLPPVVLLALAVHVGRRIRSGEDSQQVIAPVVLAVLGTGLYAKALTRYDAIHALPALLGLLPVLGLLAERSFDRRRPRFVLAARAIGSSVVATVYLMLPAAALAQVVSAYPPTGCYSNRPVAACVQLWGGQEQALAALDARVPADSAVFVGLQRHDRTIGNDISLYFLAQRRVPTRYHELDPGVADTDGVQREIITELQRARVEWLVLVDFPNPGEPNASSRSSGVKALDEFIRSRYVPVHTVSRYQLWRHRARDRSSHERAMDPARSLRALKDDQRVGYAHYVAADGRSRVPKNLLKELFVRRSRPDILAAVPRQQKPGNGALVVFETPIASD